MNDGWLAILANTIDAGPTQGKIIVTIELGANDLYQEFYGGTGDYSTNPNGFTTALYSMVQEVLAIPSVTGVVVHTVLPRGPDFGGGTQMESDRATANTTIRSWASATIAIADWASDATMGAYATASNATYYNGELHPTTAGYALLAPYTSAAINSLS